VALTGTGPESYERLQKAKNRLQQEYEDIRRRIYRHMRQRDEWPVFTADQMPRLQFSPPNLGEATKAALNDILILVILNVAFFLGAFVLFLRYDVR